MINIIKVKDWLKERSGKQFDFISPDKEVVFRLKDKHYFVVGDKLKIEGERWEFIGYRCIILSFQPDEINVFVEIENKPYKIFIPINGLGITW